MRAFAARLEVIFATKEEALKFSETLRRLLLSKQLPLPTYLGAECSWLEGEYTAANDDAPSYLLPPTVES